jgi:hypothetical protein
MGWMVQGSNPSGGEIFHAVRLALRPTRSSVQSVPDVSQGKSSWNMKLTTLLLLLGCEWVGTIPPPLLCATIVMSSDDLYFFLIMNIIERIDNIYI